MRRGRAAGDPAIRRVVRVRLQDRQLRRLLDSMDICQSVLGNFFAFSPTACRRGRRRRE
jgi:hypothetical protein